MFEELLDAVAELPWWGGLIFTCVVCFALSFIRGQWWYLGLLFLFPTAASALSALKSRLLLAGQRDLNTIRALSWAEFERVVGEAYRREGFSIEMTKKGADGGVDLYARRAGETYLVQCKHWKTNRVGVKVVREMRGLVAAKKATGAVIATTGDFTAEARRFAKGQPVRLLAGKDVVDLVRRSQGSAVGANAQRAAVVATSVPVPSTPVVPQASGTVDHSFAGKACPKCGRELTLRTARRGAHAGEQFLGCSGFPECRYVEPLEKE